MKLAITGALGFIGKHLLNALQIKPYEVLAFTRRVKSDQQKWIEQLERPIQIIEGDLAELPIENWLADVDMLIHLAWSSTPSLTKTNLEREIELNWQVSKRILDACVKSKTKLVFLSSGGTIYGEAQYLPIDEEHPKNPISAYGMVKWKVEQEILELHEVSGLEYVILRPSNTYGPGFDNSKGYGIIGHWIDQIKKNQKVVIFGDGNTKRDFIHVTDLVYLIIQSLKFSKVTLNVGSDEVISLNQLHALFEEITKQKVEIEFLKTRPFDVKYNQLLLERMKILGFAKKRQTIANYILSQNHF